MKRLFLALVLGLLLSGCNKPSPVNSIELTQAESTVVAKCWSRNLRVRLVLWANQIEEVACFAP